MLLKRLTLAVIAGLLWCGVAQPQITNTNPGSPTCPTRPSGDNSNACASTAFVQGAVNGGGTFTPNLPVIGGASGGLSQGTISGLAGTTKFPVVDGTTTNGQCAVWDSNGGLTSVNCSPSGSGTVGAGTAGQVAVYTGSTAVAGVTDIIDATIAKQVDVRSFGALCDGSTNDTTAFQNALNFNSGNVTVLVPASVNCVVASTLSIQHPGVHLIGAGQASSTITSTNGSTDNFLFTGTCFDCSIERLTINNTAATPSAGCVINSTNGTGNNRVIQVRVHKGFNGICASNSFSWPNPVGVLSIDKVDVDTMTSNGYVVTGASQFFMSDSSLFTAGGSGLLITNLGGAWIVNSTFQQAAIGIQLLPATSQRVFDIYLTNVEVDATTGSTTGISFDSSSGGLLWNIVGTNLRAGYGQGNGITLNGAGTSNITLSNFLSERNVKDGVHISNGQGITITGGHILGNSCCSSGFDGIYVNGGSSIDINNNYVTYADPTNSNSNQNWGLHVDTAFNGTLQAHHNDFSGGNVSGPFTNASGGDLDIERNIGYNPIGVTFPTRPGSTATFTNGPTDTTIILAAGTCSGLTIMGVNIPAPQCSFFSFDLPAGQTFSMTYSVAPAFTSIIK